MNLIVLGVDRIDGAFEPGAAQVAEQDAGDRIFLLAGAENDDGTGHEEGMEIVL